VFGYVTLDRVLNPFHADGFSWVEAVGDGFAGDLAVLQDDKAYKASEQAQITTWFGDLKDIAYTFVNCLTTIAVTGKCKWDRSFSHSLPQHVNLDRV